MTLRRTVGALASMHIFYKADVVVFCEGGQPKSHSDALIYTNDGRTLDSIFWSSVTSLLVKDKRMHFKSVGSKPTLLAISQDIHNAQIKTVSVCLDSDYDRILNIHSTNNRLAYTKGYSWEADAFQGAVIEEILTALVGVVPVDLMDLLRESIVRIENDLVRWCEVDISLKYRNKPCVLDRKNPLSSVDINAFPVCIAHQRLSQRLNRECGYTRKPRRVVLVGADEVRGIVFGKLISKTYYHLIVSFAKRVMSDIKIEYDNVMRLAINFTVRGMESGKRPELHSHYSSECAAF